MATAGLHVVIGGSGGAGAAVVEALLRRGHEVRALARTGWNAPDGVEVMTGDARDAAVMRRALQGASVAYQCANPPYQHWTRDFPALQSSLLAAAEATGTKVVLADNLYLYGPTEGSLREDTPVGATDAKGRLRARMAADLLAWHASGRGQVVIGRSSDYFGPGRMNSSVGEIFFGAAAAGRRPRWLGRLDAPHALTYLPDMSTALVMLAESEAASGQVWHLPMTPALTAGQWAGHIAAALGRPIPVGRISRPMMFVAGLASPLIRELRATLYQWERPWVVEDAKFRAAFPAFQPTTLADAVAATLAGHASASVPSTRVNGPA